MDKVTPLFHNNRSNGPLTDEELIRLLDLADDHPERLAFLNQCSFSDKEMQRWEQLNQVVDAGKNLTVPAPDPAIRAYVMDAAFEAVREQKVSSKQETSPSAKRGTIWLHGWKSAWAALFLVCCLTLVNNLDTTEVTDLSILELDQIDSELFALEEDMALLQADLGFDTF